VLGELLPEELGDGGDELGGDELGGDGGAELGVDGGCGGVGGLAQPARIRQTQVSPTSLASVLCVMPLGLLYDVIGLYNLLRNRWFPTREARPESRLAQFPHQLVGFAIVAVTFIKTNQVNNPAARVYTEF